MEPRPDGRGGDDAVDDAVSGAVLQWSRGLMAAEGLVSRRHGRSAARLQWSRGLMAAEGVTRPMVRSVSRCFNGAAA